MKSIVVVGSINMDLVSQAERIPRAGETVLGSAFSMFSGGKGANQAVAAARLGQRCILLGMVGDDIFGKDLRQTLTRYGVETDHIETVPGPSGVASIVVDKWGENSIIVTAGANAHVTPEYCDSKADVLREAGIVLAQLEVPLRTIAWLAHFCDEANVPFMLDPAPATALSEDVLTRVDWFTPNQTEAEFYVGNGKTPEDTIEALLGKGVSRVILKRGAEGALLSGEGREQQSIEALKVAAVDTTAAGDAFNGAFAAALMRGQTPYDSARFAAAASAISVTRRGAQPSLATNAEVLAVLDRC